MMRKLAFILAALLLVTVPAGALAQETRGALEGVVRDSTGGVLPGVLVQAVHQATSATSTATTDAAGLYRFPALAPGAYTVSATLSGFSKASNDVSVVVGQLLKVNLSMSLAGLS